MESLAIPAAATTVAASLTPKPPVWSVFGQNHAFDPKFGSFYTGIDVNDASIEVIGSGIDVSSRGNDVVDSSIHAVVSVNRMVGGGKRVAATS